MEKEKLEQRDCFGTTEYSKECRICTTCHNFIKCGNVKKRIKKKNHVIFENFGANKEIKNE